MKRIFSNAHRRWLREQLALISLFVLGFTIRLYPLLQFPRVGFDPLRHYQFSQALLQGSTSIVVVTALGEHITLYYPPLFHLLLLGFFFAFPKVDPYLVMKVIVTVLDALQVFPIYYIVKYASGSVLGATFAAFVAMITSSDLKMIAWGGYANIAGLLLIAILAYFVIKENAIAVGVVSTVLFLTHHLSMLFAVAFVLPLLLVRWIRSRVLPKSLIAFVVSGVVAFAAFYWRTLIPLFELYTTYAARYAMFTMPLNWPFLMWGFPLLIVATLGIALWVYRNRTRFLQSDLLLYWWFFLPLLLGYSFLFGIRWDVVRWIYFLQQPACVWCGICVAQLKNRKLAVLVIVLVFMIQWVISMQGYYSDILLNSGYTY